MVLTMTLRLLNITNGSKYSLILIFWHRLLIYNTLIVFEMSSASNINQ